jgi:beta-glucosidase
VRIARGADVAVMLLGEHRDMSGEARSRTTLELPGVQQRLLERVHATGTPVVLVLMNGRPLSVQWAADSVPAIVEAWYLGLQTGPALADVLFGDANPGGKLPVTFPRNVGQIPLYYGYRRTGRPPNPADPYTNKDAYTSKYFDVPWTPLFPFGHGLSYTTFEYGAPVLGGAACAERSECEIGPTDSLVVRVTVANTGTRAGDEVVQLYVRDHVASVTRPLLELRRFQRVTLAPGERRTLSFTLGPRDLAFHDAEMRRVVEPGEFTVFAGGDSVHLRSAAFRVTGATTVVP